MDEFDNYLLQKRLDVLNQRKEVVFEVAINLDLHFWAILPALNINLHSKEFEFEWLCIGIYIGKK